MCKQDLALNNLEWLICHKIKPNKNLIFLESYNLTIFPMYATPLFISPFFYKGLCINLKNFTMGRVFLLLDWLPSLGLKPQSA